MYRRCSNHKCHNKTSLPLKEKICPNCHQETDVELEVNDTLTGYTPTGKSRQFRIKKQLSKPGDAGMSTVYLAEGVDDPSRSGVLKVTKARYRQALVREAGNLQKLKHEHIIKLIYGQNDSDSEQAILTGKISGEEISFIGLQYMSGGSLKDKLREKKQLPLQQAAEVIFGISAALDYAHQQGVVHLDIKPANVLFSGNGQKVVLSDFGVTRQIEELKEIPGTIGTPAYNAPEQRQKPPVHSHKADIYGLGLILYEMLVGREVYKVRNSSSPDSEVNKNVGSPPDSPLPKKLTVDNLPLPRTLNPNIPEAVEKIILKAIAPYSADRYDSAGELAQELKAALLLQLNLSQKFTWQSLLMIGGILLLLGVSIFTGTKLFSASQEPLTPTVEIVTTAASFTPVIIVEFMPTDTPTPSPSPRPASTPINTSTPSLPTTPTPATTPTSSATAIPFIPTPATIEPLQPAKGDQIPGPTNVVFRWKWGNDCNLLLGNYSFQIKIWHHGSLPNGGAINSAVERELLLRECDDGTYTYFMGDLGAAPGVNNQRGQLAWYVVLVRLTTPPQETGVTSETNVFIW